MDAREKDVSTSEARVPRRVFLKYALAAGGAALGGYLGWTQLRPSPPPPSGCNHTPGQALAVQGEHVSITGVRKDGIPPIDHPRFVTAEEAASFVADRDLVFGLAAGETGLAFPQRILVWHEIANVVLEGAPVAVTYCPLTGSQVAYRPVTGSATPTFGTTGRLVNSNLLMYDRATDSRWPQIFGHAIEGTQRGRRLEGVPLTWTTWERWRSRHPETEVLSTDTGFVRNYQGDPYGSYDPLRGYYADRHIRFNLACWDGRFHPKRPFIGLSRGNDAAAVDLELLRVQRVRNVVLAGQPVVFLHDEGLDAPRAFLALSEAGPLRFAWDGGVRDAEMGSRWSPDGVALGGPLRGTRLEELPAMHAMWFAWAAFYPWSQVHAA